MKKKSKRYPLTTIERTFKGPFKTRENQGSTWGPDKSVEPNDRAGFECEKPPPTPSGVDAIDSRKYQLMDNAVQSTTSGPLYHVSKIQLQFLNKYEGIILL